MFAKTKIALAATFVALAGTVARAQDFDPDLANRYPAYADPGVYGYTTKGDAPTLLQPSPATMLRSAPVWFNERSVNVAQLGPQNKRPSPGNQGDTSHGQDWAQSWGGF